MTKFIIDTDIGADSDDVIALYYLLKMMKKNECEIEAITLATSRQYASSAVKNIINKSGFPNIKIGEYKGTPLKCDSFDHYSKNVAENITFTGDDATKVMKEVLNNSKEKINLICIGPLTNLANLLKSKSDEVTIKSGLDLINEKVRKVYIMGASFGTKTEPPFAEWNFEQDLESARYVSKNFPKEIILCPSETGAMVKTYLSSAKGYAKLAMDSFFKSLKDSGNNGDFTFRPSWDPLTCILALNEGRFKLSNSGYVTILENGITEFKEDKKGNIKYLLMDNDFNKVEEELNNLLMED